MRWKLILLLFVAGGAATGAAALARDWLEDRRAELLALRAEEPVKVETIDTIDVLTAMEDLPSGTFLRLEQFTWTPFPADNLPEAYFTRAELPEEDSLTGAVLRGAMTPGEPLTDGRVIRPGDRGFLAAVLRPEMRAVSVPVDATTGISGFVFPGDKVDMLLTHQIDVGGNVARLATETILTDLRVLAVDQRTDDIEGQPALARTATLEVDAQQAEVIAVALRMGRLSLALRALAQTPDALATATPSDTDRPSYTWDSEASTLLPPPYRRPAPAGTAAEKPPVKVTVFRRGAPETVEFKGWTQ